MIEELLELNKNLSTVIYSKAFPTFVVLCKLFSNQQIFNYKKFLRYAIGEEDHESLIPVASLMFTATSGLVLLTAAKQVYQRFDLTRTETQNPDELFFPLLKIKDAAKEIGVTGATLLLVVKALGVASSLFVALNAFFGGRKNLQFFANNVCHAQMEEQSWPNVSITIISLAFAVSNYIVNTTWSQPKCEKNFYKFIKKMQELLASKDIHCDRYAVMTAIIFLFGTVCVPALARFGTEHALRDLQTIHIPHIDLPTLPDELIEAFAMLSMVTASVPYVLSTIPALYLTLTSKRILHEPIMEHWYDPFMKPSLYTCGAINAASFCISNFVSLAFFLSMQFSLSDKNPYLIGVCVVMALCTTILDYVLNVLERYKDMLQQKQSYQLLRSSIEEEPANTEEKDPSQDGTNAEEKDSSQEGIRNSIDISINTDNFDSNNSLNSFNNIPIADSNTSDRFTAPATSSFFNFSFLNFFAHRDPNREALFEEEENSRCVIC